MEYEKPAIKPQREALAELVQQLGMLGTGFERLQQNFAWCAAVLAEKEGTPDRIKGMMEFSREYHRLGLDKAIETIEKDGGIPIELIIPDIEFAEGTDQWRLRTTSVDDRMPALVVGLVGVVKDANSPTFAGVAYTEDIYRRGIDGFVLVRINETGMTTLDPEHFRRSNREKTGTELIEEFYPPTPPEES